MKIGIVSDTHGYFDPQLRSIFAGVEAILHAGDVGSMEILDELRAIAPVHAIAGNVDAPELGQPPSLRLDFGDCGIEMLHILPVPQSEVEAWGGAVLRGGQASARSERFLRAFDPSTRVVIFGHSHQPCLVNLGDRLFFNPGSAGKKRFSLPRTCGRLESTLDRIEATILSLEGYNGKVLEKMQLDLELGVSESHADLEKH